MLIPPISVPEFAQLLQKCIPRGTLDPSRIAVANSGGPDSMCLLYLLSEAAKTFGPGGGFPTTVYSIHINHDLQPANAAMAQKVSALAARLQVQDIQYKLPWGSPPFPSRPAQGAAFEELARDARSHMVFKATLEWHTKCIAYGHHADDQVETVLMRLMRGSGPLGASGMRRVRAWGMGSDDQESLRYAGLTGLSRLIVRPFLEIPKDRLLATCEANNIDYVTDPSNFQPDITPRNYIRKYLSSMQPSATVQRVNKGPIVLPTQIEETHSSGTSSIAPLSLQTHALEGAIRKLQRMTSTIDLKQAVRKMAHEHERRESVVLRHFTGLRLLSPRSTYLFGSDMLTLITDVTERTLFIRRILRFVSPHAWGSPAAEAYGRQNSLERIISVLGDTATPPGERRRFSAGASVLWTPVAIGSNGTMHVRPNLRGDELPGWIAQRQPPLAMEPNPLTMYLDIRKVLSYKNRSITYDNRFRISFEKEQLPPDLTENDTLAIFPTTQWFLPSVKLKTQYSPHFKTLCEFPFSDMPSVAAEDCLSISTANCGITIKHARPAADI